MEGEKNTSTRIYEFIVNYHRAHGGISPSFREIAEAVGVTPRTVSFHIDRMKDKIKHEYNGKRDLTPVAAIASDTQ